MTCPIGQGSEQTDFGGESSSETFGHLMLKVSRANCCLILLSEISLYWKLKSKSGYSPNSPTGMYLKLVVNA